MNKHYVIVTTISQHKIRYCIPVDALDTDDPNVAQEWAKDSVTMEEVHEFSQDWVGETIIDSTVVDQTEVLKMFDKDNEYLKGWTTEQKLNYIDEWRVDDESR